MRRLRVEVPATSANLGSGFDTLGLALDMVNTIHVELDPESQDVSLCDVTGSDVHSLHPQNNLLCRSYRAWADDTGATLPGARFTLESRVPMGRGLGSSAASIVAGLAAAAKAVEEKNPRERILRLGTLLEGHADNIAAATMGGVTTVYRDGETVHALHVANHLSLGVALFIPNEPLSTGDARAALPQSIPLADAVFNIGRLAYLTTALIWGKWELIGPAMQDRLHQPYRLALIPALNDVIAAAIDAGAYGAALSGGGPAVIALGPSGETASFAAAMETRAQACGWEGSGLVTHVRERGVMVMEAEAGSETL